MASLKRFRAKAARGRAERAVPVLQRMEEARLEAEADIPVVVRVPREPRIRSWILLPVGLLLATVMAGLTLGWWPFDTVPVATELDEWGRGREELLQIEALRIISVRESTGNLPADLDAIEPGLGELLNYEVLGKDRFRLGLAGREGAADGQGLVYDAADAFGRVDDGR